MKCDRCKIKKEEIMTDHNGRKVCISCVAELSSLDNPKRESRERHREAKYTEEQIRRAKALKKIKEAIILPNLKKDLNISDEEAKKFDESRGV